MADDRQLEIFYKAREVHTGNTSVACFFRHDELKLIIAALDVIPDPTPQQRSLCRDLAALHEAAFGV